MPTQKDPSTFGYQNFFSTTLTGDITSGTLTIGLATVPTPTSGILIIEPDSTSSREVVFYTSKGASTVTCPSDGRGWSGTSASAHLTGSTVIMASVDEYFEGLADGTLSTDPLRSTLFGNHVVSGGAVAQSSGLIGTFSDIVFYLNGQRYTGSTIANKTYTASKDTYVDITATSGGTVTVAYNEVANGATAPTLAANYIRLAKVVTNGSAITSVVQNPSSDGIGNAYRPLAPLSARSMVYPVKFSVYRTAALNSSASSTVVAYDTKLFDTGNNVDVTTNKGRFTAPVAGFYIFSALVGNSAAASTLMILQLNINGSLYHYGEVATPANGNNRHPGNWLVQLNAGDYVEILFTGGGGSVIAVGKENCWFQGYLLSTS